MQYYIYEQYKKPQHFRKLQKFPKNILACLWKRVNANDWFQNIVLSGPSFKFIYKSFVIESTFPKSW